VSDYEKYLSKNSSPKRSKEFIYSRLYLREFLADFFNIKPLNVPLEAPRETT